MTRFVSMLPGVDVKVEQIDGRSRFLQVIKCSACPNTLEITNSKSAPLPWQVLARKGTQNGWWIDMKKGKHVCSTCLDANRYKPGPRQAKPEPAPIGDLSLVPERARARRTPVPITIEGRTFPSLRAAGLHYGVHWNTLRDHLDAGTIDEMVAAAKARTTYGTPGRTLTGPAKPKEDTHAMTTETTTPAAVRQPTPADNRRIFLKMDEVYDPARQRYVDDWTDLKVSEDLGVPRRWVEDIRETAFGPAGGNDAMDDLAKQMEDTLAKLNAAVDEAMDVAARTEKLSKEVEALRERLRALEKSVGGR